MRCRDCICFIVVSMQSSKSPNAFHINQAKQITNRVVVNEDPTSIMIRALRGEIESLKMKLNGSNTNTTNTNTNSSKLDNNKKDTEMNPVEEEHNLSASEATRRMKCEKNVDGMSKEQLLVKISELNGKLSEAEKDSKERGE